MGPRKAIVINTEDTIVAIGSSQTPAARGAVRVSGQDSIKLAQLMGIQPRSEHSAHRVDTQIDVGTPLGLIPVRALLWPTCRSYTGQPSLEIHTFGSLPILQAIMRLAVASGGRAARPGEFTLRAFLAGRLDLTQAEAVLGVIDAQQRSSLDHALRQLAGNLSRPMEFLRSQLLDLLADVEAGLDFVDEDIQFVSDHDLVQRLQEILNSVTTAREQLVSRTQDKSEFTIALRGRANAGKSQLLNSLCGRDVAIVADLAGTTRDVVSVPTTIGKHHVVLMDTAGIETKAGSSLSEPDSLSKQASLLEQISLQAQQHADRAGREADIRIWCVDQTASDYEQVTGELKVVAQRKRNESRDVWVATKCDTASSQRGVHSPWRSTSSLTGHGIENLRADLESQLDQLDQSESTSIAGTASRCNGSLRSAEIAITAAIEYVNGNDGHEYVSSELRLAAAAIGEVTGAVYTDDVLDRVFSRFCIGK